MINTELGGTRQGALDLRHLTALVAIAHHQSFSLAAESLGYTQSAVSQQIMRLEAAVGHKLVERPGGPVRVALTAAGEILVGHAEAIVSRVATAAADLDAYASGTAGVLRIGCFQSVGVRILPRLIRDFSAAAPQVRVELTEVEDDAELLRRVEEGSLDVTFLVFPLPAGPFDSIRLIEDPYVVVVNEDSPLAHQEGPVQLSQLDALPLITYARMRAEHAIENRLGRPQLADQIVFRSNDNGTILGLAAEGVGAAIISWLSVDPDRRGIRVLSLAEVSPRIVGIAWHSERQRTPAAESFVRITASLTSGGTSALGNNFLAG